MVRHLAEHIRHYMSRQPKSAVRDVMRRYGIVFMNTSPPALESVENLEPAAVQEGQPKTARFATTAQPVATGAGDMVSLPPEMQMPRPAGLERANPYRLCITSDSPDDW